MGLAHSPRIVTDGLVLCLDAASKRSYPGTGTTWTDLKANKSGAMQNMTDNFSSENAGRLTFDGSNEYVSFSNGEDIFPNNNIFSITFWQYIQGRNSSVFHLTGPSTSNEVWIMNSSTSFAFGDNLVFAVNASPASDYWSTGFIPPLNEWMNITFVKTSSSAHLYVDSALTASTSYSRSINLGSNMPFYIGTDPDPGGFSQFMNGYISSLSVYNRALSADEIRQNYLSTKERYA